MESEFSSLYIFQAQEVNEVVHQLFGCFFRNADGIFIVFDVTNQKSFENVEHWYQSVQKLANHSRVVIVGNKSDLVDKRQG